MIDAKLSTQEARINHFERVTKESFPSTTGRERFVCFCDTNTGFVK